MSIINAKCISLVNGLMPRKRKMSTYYISESHPVEVPDISVDEAPLVALQGKKDINSERQILIPFRRHNEELYSPVVTKRTYPKNSQYMIHEHVHNISESTMTEDITSDVASMYGHICEHVDMVSDTAIVQHAPNISSFEDMILPGKNRLSSIPLVSDEDLKTVASVEPPVFNADDYLAIDGVLYQKSRGVFLQTHKYSSLRTYTNMNQDMEERLVNPDGSIEYGLIRNINFRTFLPVLMSYIQHIEQFQEDLKTKVRIDEFNGFYIHDIAFMEDVMRRDYGRILYNSILDEPLFNIVLQKMNHQKYKQAFKEEEIKLQKERILEQYGLKKYDEQCIRENYSMDSIKMYLEALKGISFNHGNQALIQTTYGGSFPRDSATMYRVVDDLEHSMESIKLSHTVPDDLKTNLFIDNRTNNVAAKINSLEHKPVLTLK